MLALLKLLQSLIKTLHSDGRPWQIAVGVALGSALGLTPLVSAHNVLIVLLLCVVNVSFGAGMLGWVIFTPLGFALDPLFDKIGRALLIENDALRPLWTTWYNTPGVPFTAFNNTVTLGSLVGWAVLFLPIVAVSWWFVLEYRRTLGARLEKTKAMQAIKASQLYNVYRWFSPE